MNFDKRSKQDELMDQQGIGFDEFSQCLSTLEKINVLTLAYRPTLRWVGNIAHDKALSLVDAGSGGGDMLRRLAKRYPHLTMTGIDLNPWSERHARKVTQPGLRVDYRTADILSFSAEDKIDVIISSLFTHHLSDEQLIRFIRWMDDTARHGWFINDLHRHPVAYYFIKYAVRLFCKNRLIRHDAPVSVARSFTRKDWEDIVSRSGIDRSRVKIRWHFPFRYCVSCLKT